MCVYVMYVYVCTLASNTHAQELKVSVAALEEALKAEKDEQFIGKMNEFTKATNQRMQMIVDSAAKVSMLCMRESHTLCAGARALYDNGRLLRRRRRQRCECCVNASCVRCVVCVICC
jgi:hypothetical protein